MELGVHFMNFSGLGGNTQLAPKLAATAQAADEAGFSLLTMMDHWFQMEAVRAAAGADARGLHVARFRRRQDEATDARAHGHRRHVPPPRPAGKDRDHARRALRGPRDVRRRRRLVPARARGPGCAISADQRAVRAPRGDDPDLQADVERQRRAVRRQVLPARRDHLLTATDPETRTEDPHRRRRREEDA